MKKILLLLAFLITSIGYSQGLALGFETSETGGVNGGTFGNMPAPVLEAGTGSNTSRVLKLVGNTGGEPWQGLNLNLSNPVQLTTTKTMTIDVRSAVPITFLVKVNGGVAGAPEAAAAVTHNGDDTWQTLSFTFNTALDGKAATANGVYNSFVIHTYWEVGRTQFFTPTTVARPERTFYVDNIRGPLSLPNATVGTFTVPAKNVGDPTFTITPPTSNNTSPFTYSSSNNGVATIVNGNQIQVGAGGTSIITASQVSDGVYGPTSRTATFIVNLPPAPASPTPPMRSPESVFSLYTGNPSESSYANPVGFNMVRAPWTGGTVSDLNFPNGTNTAIKLDNFGFFGYVTDQEPVRFSVAGMTKLHLDIYVNTPLPNLFFWLLSNGDQRRDIPNLVAGWNSIDIDLSEFPGANLSSIYGLKFEQNGATRQIYLDNIYFYVPAGIEPTITDFTIEPKVFGDAPFELTAPNSNSPGAFTYGSSNTDVATISGTTVTLNGPGTAIITATQVAAGGYEGGTISTELVVSSPPLATAAPTPPERNAWDVVSLYSNAYTNIESASWQGASSLSDESLEGNDTKKMSNFLVEFINFSATDVSQMTTLHMDIYTPDCTGFNIWLLNNGDRNAQFFPTLNGWNSIDIPLSTYINAGLNLNGIIFLKFESLNGPGKTVYVDNVYFYRAATQFPATVGTFTVPAKTVGDANFTLTPPTSNNTNPFTYSSSNQQVATIEGDVVTIVGGGSTIITASQTSDGTYGPSSTTATFVVNFPAPSPSPIPPTRDPAKVVSMYSGIASPSEYANSPDYILVKSSWTGGPNGGNLTEIPNGTDTALRIDDLGFIGLVDQTERRLNVSAMTNLHLDIYVNEPISNLFFWLLAPGDQRRDIQDLVPGWNSININLAEFPGANLTDIYGLKFEQNSINKRQIYVDNIYFSDDNVTYYADNDGDGYGNPLDTSTVSTGQPDGYVLNNTDCDDAAFGVNPGVSEVAYDGIDNDCNGVLDNGFAPFTANMVSCGTTLANIASLISCVSTPNAVGYQFEIRKVVNGVPLTDEQELPQTIVRSAQFFSLTSLANFEYATTYSVRVMLRRAGQTNFVGYYGTACLYSTPAVTSPVGGAGSVQLQTYCDDTLPSINTLISTTSLQGATGYRFRVTNSLTGDVQTLDRPLHWFSLTMLQRFHYGTTYIIDVAVRTTQPFPTNPAEVAYGASCTVTTPALPSLTAYCDSVVPTKGTNITTASLNKATLYKFEVTRYTDATLSSIVDVSTLDRTQQWFTFNNISNYSPNTYYSVRVSVMTSGTFPESATPGQLLYSDACVIQSPSLAREIAPVATSMFEAVGYPNPYDYEFGIKLNTTSHSMVSIKVYNMVGKLIEQREVAPTEISVQAIGERFSTGVYNVVVSQDGNAKSLRMIKR